MPAAIMVSSMTMARLALRIVVLAIVVLGVFASGSLLADGRVDFLAERLKYPPAAGQADDFRVRTNAALALGATGDDGAVAPLCAGLGDPSEVVRQAVAVALKRLARASSGDCLRKRAAVEPNSSVKLQIQRALEAIDAASGGGGGGGSSGGGAAPPTVSGAKFYVSISPVSNQTTRPGAEVERLVHDAIASKLASLGEYQLAPAGESNADAKAAVAKRKLKGYYLAVSVDKFDYSDGNLRVRVKIAVSSYPGKDLRGEVPAAATLPGARPGDKGAEDQLMGVVAGRAAELFAQNFR
jgi:HEAT repeats